MTWICEDMGCREYTEIPVNREFYATTQIDCDENQSSDYDDIRCSECGILAEWCTDCSSDQYCYEHSHSTVGEVYTSEFSTDIKWIKKPVTQA